MTEIDTSLSLAANDGAVPEVTAHQLAAEQVSADAARLPIHEIATFLREQLGQRMTAYISGVNDPKMVSHWIAQHNTPRDGAQMRLREGYQAARLLVDSYSAETAKAWFFSSNARLNDQAPAFVLRHARNWEELRLILPAARAFIGASG
jgi:hypothetical protein